MVEIEKETLKSSSKHVECDKEDNVPEKKASEEFVRPPHLPKNASDFRIFIYEVSESKAFGGAILFVILLNTVILVAQTSEELIMKGGENLSSFFHICPFINSNFLLHL